MRGVLLSVLDKPRVQHRQPSPSWLQPSHMSWSIVNEDIFWMNQVFWPSHTFSFDSLLLTYLLSWLLIAFLCMTHSAY
ncbi:hypothetical protein BC827DRAFT_1168710 [Russula dissimulans]|nr:hypothetical protein BC827DRAFT_1168710 [Russula dissimulans]